MACTAERDGDWQPLAACSTSDSSAPVQHAIANQAARRASDPHSERRWKDLYVASSNHHAGRSARTTRQSAASGKQRVESTSGRATTLAWTASMCMPSRTVCTGSQPCPAVAQQPDRHAMGSIQRPASQLHVRPRRPNSMFTPTHGPPPQVCRSRSSDAICHRSGAAGHDDKSMTNDQGPTTVNGDQALDLLLHS